MTDHLKEARNGNDSKVYRAIRKYKITREDFEVIENNIETQEKSDEREIYWISFYNSYKEGYNSTLGGDVGNGGLLKGEDSPKAIFTNEEVRQIRVLRACMKYTKEDIYSIYADRVSGSGFSKIWNYETYTDVAPELNTEEIIKFYKHSRVGGSKNKNNRFTTSEVIEIRNKYYIEAIPSRKLAVEYNVNKSCIERLVAGKTYSDIPLPTPSIKYKRKFHVYLKEEIDTVINDFVKSKKNIKDYLSLIKKDQNNIFGGYSYSAFREFIIRELSNRGLEYIANGKWNFEIKCNT